jgi:hypothetical protein
MMLSEDTEMGLNGAPLAVCVNDCQIDSGQPPSKLKTLCFRVSCDFAEMRWGLNNRVLSCDGAHRAR